MTRRRPPDWFGRLIALCGAVSFVLGIVGFWLALHPQTPREAIEVFYKTLGMFSLVSSIPLGAEPLPFWLLQVARFGAFLTTISALLKALFPQALRAISLWGRASGRSCAVVLGYGPIGQAIAAGLRQDHTGMRRITAVHPVITPDLAARAYWDDVLLVEGNPSDPLVLARVHARRAQRVYVSDTDDLRAIDTAVALRTHRADPQADIRVVLNDSAVAGQMAEATGAGFLGVPGLRWFSLADETARLLIAEARFDRVAVETGAKQLHLVILGCGSQGEAIAVETLLTGWRTALGPPRITFLDKDAAGIEARMRRRMPAWFLKQDGEALPEGARPVLDFRPCDAETLDFARDACLDGLREGVSGWVFATGNDALNLRASLALHRAIAMRQIDPAPFYVRIPSGHVDEAPDLVGQPLTMAHTFGAINSVIARSSMLDPDPDALPKKLHAAYALASVEMGLPTSSEDWDSLPESKRNANRAIFRHAAMKLEDFGAEAQPVLTGLPKAAPDLCRRIKAVDQALDYARIDAVGTPQDWLLAGKTLTTEDAQTALRLRDAAICEHNRWTIERALEQFIPTDRPEYTLRDDARRLHNNMHDWFSLEEANIRRYDVVLLLGLLSEAGGGRTDITRNHRARVLVLPILADGQVGAAHVSALGATSEVDVTELQVHLFVAKEPVDPGACVAALMKALQRELDPERQILPRRLRFDFVRPPGERTLALANLLATDLRRRHGAKITIELLWAWKADTGPTIGVVGHRDLVGFGTKDAVTERLRQTFMTLAVQRRAESLVCGFAPGADQCAVKAWTSLGLPPPRLIFPFADRAAQGAEVFHTDDPALATRVTAFPKDQLLRTGKPTPPDEGSGHSAQAASVLSRADILVAIVDEARDALSGGTVETVRKARAEGKEVLVIGPDQQ